MKNRIILLIVLTLCTAGVFAQGKLVFDPATWDFGTIREIDGRVSHTFTGENRGDRPLVILDVVTSCGCTVPRFSQRPILPGTKTEITVTFDPTNRPGIFDKDLTVYSSDRRKIATLTIHGEVIPRPKSLEELYPVDAGGGLRLTTTLNAFAYLRTGQRVQGTFGYVNTSDRPIRLTLRPLHTSGLLRLDAPSQIAPGEQGSISSPISTRRTLPATARSAMRWRSRSTAAATAQPSSPTASASMPPPLPTKSRPRKANFRKISLNSGA